MDTRALEADDLVVTPTGRRAQILAKDAHGFCRLRYIGGEDSGTEVVIHERLLARMRRGKEAPPPVRIAALQRR